MKKALIFSPYFETPGGGEVYSLNFAQCLQNNNYSVTFAWKNSKHITSASKFLDINLKPFDTNPKLHNLLTSRGKILQKRSLLKKFDLTFFVSDGSVPYLFSPKNILHFQVPFTSLKSSFINNAKLRNINYVICNSNFTKKTIDTRLKINSQVVYPPASINTQAVSNKLNIILSVGRFTTTLHNKRQDILIKAFKNLVNLGVKDWKLQLVGSTSQKESKAFVKLLKKQAKGYPIEFLTDVNASRLIHANSQAKIFWLATGYDVDEDKHPEKVEHFGIATVQAMAAGCVPVVINKGGQKEIIQPGVNGLLFDTIDDLVTKTQELIKSNTKLSNLSKAAIKASKKFSKQIFCQSIDKLIS